jgi:hypothetical protein
MGPRKMKRSDGFVGICRFLVSLGKVVGFHSTSSAGNVRGMLAESASSIFPVELKFISPPMVNCTSLSPLLQIGSLMRPV